MLVIRFSSFYSTTVILTFRIATEKLFFSKLRLLRFLREVALHKIYTYSKLYRPMYFATLKTSALYWEDAKPQQKENPQTETAAFIHNPYTVAVGSTFGPLVQISWAPALDHCDFFRSPHFRVPRLTNGEESPQCVSAPSSHNPTYTVNCVSSNVSKKCTTNPKLQALSPKS